MKNLLKTKKQLLKELIASAHVNAINKGIAAEYFDFLASKNDSSITKFKENAYAARAAAEEARKQEEFFRSLLKNLKNSGNGSGGSGGSKPVSS